MDEAFKVLVIIVSSTLTVFLLVLIVVGVKLIQVLQGLRHITEQAEKIADSAEAASEFFRKSASRVAFGHLLSNITESVMKHKKKGD